MAKRRAEPDQVVLQPTASVPWVGRVTTACGTVVNLDLTSWDREILQNEAAQQFINDAIIGASMIILHQQFPDIDGLEETTLAHSL